MIISHKFQFVFLKPRKTAGTSIELFLSGICGKHDIITPFIFEPDKNIRKKTGALEPQNYRINKKLSKWTTRDLYHLFRYFMWPGVNLKEHDQASKVLEITGRETWENYFKFSIVRNPWDQAVSLYEWKLYQGKKYSFEDFLLYYYYSIWDIISVDGENLDMDKIIFFESLEDGVYDVLNTLGVNKEIRLPRAKTNIRKEKDYRVKYNNSDFLIELVRRKNQKLLNHFDYTF